MVHVIIQKRLIVVIFFLILVFYFFPDNSVIPSSDSVVNVCISDGMNDYDLTSPLVSLPFADDPSFLFFSLICGSYNFLSDVGLCS